MDALKETTLGNLDGLMEAFTKVISAIRGVFEEKASPRPTRVSTSAVYCYRRLV